ncbi:hypothetical protein SBBP2_130028 [Burkholderiales bacterium]|nr:hypothetical protein SBBP2_130028 [Burkholderiales bacterium]
MRMTQSAPLAPWCGPLAQPLAPNGLRAEVAYCLVRRYQTDVYTGPLLANAEGMSHGWRKRHRHRGMEHRLVRQVLSFQTPAD